jgi:hypothetical protein
MGKGKTVDVQCLVDGEDARGNNTWAKPVDQNCFLPAEIFTKEQWFGKFELHAPTTNADMLVGTSGGKC